MDTTKNEAQAMLAEAQRASRAVYARSAKEHVPYYGWGAFQALVIPGFDLVDRSIWGWVTIAIAALGFVATGAYYATRSRHVQVPERSPWWTWLALTAWMCLAGGIAVAFDGALGFSYVLGGWIGAVPLFVWGSKLRRTA